MSIALDNYLYDWAWEVDLFYPTEIRRFECKNRRDAENLIQKANRPYAELYRGDDFQGLYEYGRKISKRKY